MRYSACGLLILFCLVSFTVLGHRPSNMEITPDLENNKLNITMFHYTEDPRAHYINKVEIYVDDKEPLVKRFYFQKHRNRKLVTVDVPDLQEATKIVVIAYSRKGGKLEKELILKSPEEEEDSDQ